LYICALISQMIKSIAPYKDSQLIEGIKRKDGEAFKQLYRYHTGAFKTMILNNGGTKTDADDIEQLVIIHLYEKVITSDFKLTAKLSTYLYSVARNMWLKRASKKNLTLSSDDDTLNLPEISEEIEIQIDPKDDEEEILVKSIANLGDTCKQILTKFYYKKKSMRTISNELPDFTEDNLRKRKYKCMQQLKKIFEQKKQHG